MGRVRFSGNPGRKARAAVLGTFSPKFILIPLFIIFAAVCLVIAGCTDEEVIAPNGNGDEPDDPICPITTPWVEIVAPDVGAAMYYPPRITFSWEQDQEHKIAFTRYMIVELAPGETGTDMLNEHPEQFDDLWTEWKQWDPAGDSAVIGEEDPLENGIYFFAVQAMDSCGKETDHFDELHNARQFTVRTTPPFLVLYEPMLGSGAFLGTLQHPPAALVLPGVIFTFQWQSEPLYSWFGPIQYRYGWDIQNLWDDGEWTYPWSSQIKWSHSMSFSSGVHVFHVEARDNAGSITRARVEIEVIPFTGEHDLLWIDDIMLGDVHDPLGRWPSETEHDEFWTGICSRAPGFNPIRDIYDADIYSRDKPIPLELLADYRYVVWTYGGATDNAWSHTIEFEPAPTTDFPTPNNLRMFLAAGGAVLTCGRGDLGGSALSATFKENPLFPASVTGDLGNYDYDEAYARHSMAYDDYYVTVIDKVIAQFRTDLPPGVIRSMDRDAMMMALRDTWVSSFLPDTLLLSGEITQPGMFFDPAERGFIFVEVYDPQYYMDHLLKYSHSCFSPIYRMRSRSTRSPLDYAPVAIVTASKYCEAMGRDSYHFGLPLWYIDHGQVEQITHFIFGQWSIR